MLPAVLSGALRRKKEPIPPHQIYMTSEYASGDAFNKTRTRYMVSFFTGHSLLTKLNISSTQISCTAQDSAL